MVTSVPNIITTVLNHCFQKYNFFERIFYQKLNWFVHAQENKLSKSLLVRQKAYCKTSVKQGLHQKPLSKILIKSHHTTQNPWEKRNIPLTLSDRLGTMQRIQYKQRSSFDSLGKHHAGNQHLVLQWRYNISNLQQRQSFLSLLLHLSLIHCPKNVCNTSASWLFEQYIPLTSCLYLSKIQSFSF